MQMRLWALALTVGALGGAAAWAVQPSAEILAREDQLRKMLLEGQRPPGPGGADPVDVVRMSNQRAVVALRGTSEVALVDDHGRVLSRVPSARSTRSLAVLDDTVFAVGEQDGRVLAHGVHQNRLGPARVILAPRGDARLLVPKAIAAARHAGRLCLFVVDDAQGELLAFDAEGSPGDVHRTPTGARPFEVTVVGGWVVTLTLIGRAADAHPMREGCRLGSGVRVAEHDGPIWSLGGLEARTGLAFVFGGVEDHPLDRTKGFFGFVDSFAFFSTGTTPATVERRGALNLSGLRPASGNRDMGVVTPKAIVVEGSPTRARVDIVGAGGDRMAHLEGDLTKNVTPKVTTRPLPPGGWAAARLGRRLLVANPLLDAVVVVEDGAPGQPPPRPRIVPVSSPTAPRGPAQVRLGEALATTGLMAEHPSAEGSLSVFSCETCHHELSVDGRTHFTGRTDPAGRPVFATTKSLLGLLPNRPHFTRALDDTTSKMIENEFKVVARGTEGRARFSLSVDDHRWLTHLGFTSGQELTPAQLRAALLAYLASLSPPRSPWARERSSFNDLERRGAKVFEARCAGCHPARVLADVPSSVVPFPRWNEAIFGDGPRLIWARAGHEKTGVEPYVHEMGARPSSLRALWMKAPYFTSGEAKTVREVLERVRWTDEGLVHRPADDRSQVPGTAAAVGRLAPDDVDALEAFLKLL